MVCAVILNTINPYFMTFSPPGFPQSHSILNLTFLPPRKNHGTFRINFFIEVVCFCDKHSKSLEENRFWKNSFFYTSLINIGIHLVVTVGVTIGLNEFYCWCNYSCNRRCRVAKMVSLVSWKPDNLYIDNR